jgi:phosphatidylserine/phosphatidylglycerophosphate/cardiolipin synthase-like enzyme
LFFDEVTFQNDLFRSRLQRIQEAGAEVHICMNDGRKNSMHLKAAVFDEVILWRGSANCSIAADTANSEDISRILVLRKKPAA